MPNQTVFGDKPITIRNKKIIKSGNMKFYNAKEETPESIIECLEEEHQRTKFYSLFSGGKDSMSTTHWLDSIGKLEAVVHIKTNIGLQMTTDFVEEICKEQNWKLHIIEPSNKYIYAASVLQRGFPGPGLHQVQMGQLKLKTMRDFALTIDRDNHCLISGVRKFESKRRMGNYPCPIQTEGALWFGCPMFYKTSEETYKYVHEHGLRISPAYALGLGTSGECLCGSFAAGGEKAWIKEHDPKLARYIEWLEEGIQEFGTNDAKRFPKWGGQTKMTELQQQQQLDDYFKTNPDMEMVKEMEGMVCGAECGAGTMRSQLDY